MVVTGRRVLAIELDEELAQLVAVILTQVGYAVTATVCGPSAMGTATALNPDVILLDMELKGMACARDLLAALRSDKDTQGIPLLVISDTESVLQDAQRSFNVRQGLLKPYDIDALIDGINAAVAGIPLLPHPSRPATTSAQAVQAVDAIVHATDTIMVEWLRRVQQAFGAETLSAVPTRVLIGNVTVWLVALVSVLRYGPTEVSGRAEIRGKLLRHIQAAQQYGVHLALIIKQFEILRDTVWEALERAGLEQLTTAEVFELGRVLNRAVDEVIIQVAEVYTTAPPLPR